MSTPPAGDMPRIVFMAYYFPPIAGAGTQRTAAFARHLPEFGYEPIIVCAGELDPGPHSIAHDETLLSGLQDTMSITRIPSIERQFATAADHRSLRRLIASPQEIAWARRAADATIFAARRQNAAAIVISVSPYICATMVREIQRRAGVPVILDLRDPWSLDGWRSFRFPFQRWIDRRMMRSSLRAADLVIANCPAAGHAYRDRLGVDPKRLVVIPNGFDTKDFPARRTSVRDARPADPDSPFRVVHLGTLHDPSPETAGPRRPRPFACAHLERHLRSGRTIIRAAGQLRRDRPDIADRLRLEFHGSVHPGHIDLAEQEGVADLLTIHPYVDHERAVSILTSADVLLVPLHGTAPGDEALIVPGKLYETIASGRPVLATVPGGDARRLVRLAGGDGRVLEPDDFVGTAEALAAWIEGSLSGWRPEGAPRELLSAFSRRSLTGRLAAAIDAVQGLGTLPADDPWIELAGMTSQVDGGTPLRSVTESGRHAA
jgi:glycosyltransferase involved in cell wall biosynthesis